MDPYSEAVELLGRFAPAVHTGLADELAVRLRLDAGGVLGTVTVRDVRRAREVVGQAILTSEGQVTKTLFDVVRMRIKQCTVVPKHPGGRPAGVAMPCGWCGEPLTASKIRKHFVNCPKRPKMEAQTGEDSLKSSSFP